MKKRIYQLLVLLLSAFQIVQAQKIEITGDTLFYSLTHQSICYNNKPLDDIYMENDSLFLELITNRKRSSFVIDIEIWKSDTHGEFSVTSLEGVVVNGKKSSLWRKGGREALREDTYYNGLLDGVSRVYTYDGKCLYQTIFDKGTGYYKDYYYDNKQLFIHGAMRNGKRTGRWYTYYKNGTLKYDETYRDGLLDGKYTSYDEKGNILYSTEFSNGTGWLKTFDVSEGYLWEEGPIEKGYRVGTWTKVSDHFSFVEHKMVLRETKIEQNLDSPENKRMYHNLIEVVYHGGRAYYINASDPGKK